MLKCIIVDDEPVALNIMESYIEKVDALQMVARCKNAIEAHNFLKEQRVDLIFLDIEMPQLSGMNFLRSLNTKPKVILTTAYHDYALEAFDLDVIDYLLKPISFERFLKSVNKVLGSPEQLKPDIEKVDLEPFIYLKADRKMVKVFLNDILYLESMSNYVRVKIQDKKEVITLQNISYFEEKLSSESFIRIHRSFIVALDKIHAYSTNTVEIAGTELSIGKSYKENFLSKVKDLEF